MTLFERWQADRGKAYLPMHWDVPLWGNTGRLRPQLEWLFIGRERTLAGHLPDDALAPEAVNVAA